MAVDSQAFRAALGSFATGVTVVTCYDRARAPAGVTISAFSSLSLDPPLVLFCLGRTSQALDAFLGAVGFAVNILGAGQRSVSTHFASVPAAERFTGLAWEDWARGGPVLTGVAAALDCRRVRVVDGGDHLIFIGEVEAASVAGQVGPLVYHRGAYAELASPG